MRILNKKNRLVFLCLEALLFAFIFVQCNNGFEHSTEEHLVFNKTSLVKCTSDTSQSYYLYLPVNYDSRMKWPVIFIYDPQGDGILCIEKFKKSAERFGYILVGSNNSRNGVAAIDNIIHILTKDVLEKCSIDRQRIYAAGFSGGARVASMHALLSGNVKGIMIAGAGVNTVDFKNLKQRVDIFATAGLGDFNYGEVMSLSQQLQGLDWRYVLREFEGTHAWPPEAVINEAVLWFTMNAMRDKVLPINKPWIKKLMAENLDSIDAAIASGRYLLAEQEINHALAFFRGLKAVKKLEQKLDKIRENPDYKIEAEKKNSSFLLENELKQGYLDCFSTKDTVWWKDQVKVLNQQVAQNDGIYSRQMYMRVKGFLGIVAYSFTNDIILRNQMDQAERLIAIYQLLEPLNPDAFFFKAMMYDRWNKTDDATLYLFKAKEQGFSDWKKFNALASDQLKARMDK
jgi:predicted esterase